jgi:hypothetical protein
LKGWRDLWSVLVRETPTKNVRNHSTTNSAQGVNLPLFRLSLRYFSSSNSSRDTRFSPVSPKPKTPVLLRSVMLSVSLSSASGPPGSERGKTKDRYSHSSPQPHSTQTAPLPPAPKTPETHQSTLSVAASSPSSRPTPVAQSPRRSCSRSFVCRKLRRVLKRWE